MEEALTFEPVRPSDPDAEALMAMLDAEIDALYRGVTGTGSLSEAEKAAFDGVFIVARRGGEPVACGAMHALDGTTGEVRRVYAKPAERGSGVARALMAMLERAARRARARARAAGDRRPPDPGDRLLRSARLHPHTGLRSTRRESVVHLLREAPGLIPDILQEQRGRHLVAEILLPRLVVDDLPDRRELQALVPAVEVEGDVLP